MTRVFAYGSNLHPDDRRRLGEEPGFLTPGPVVFLPDRRLAFTRFSTGRQGGVLDVIAAPGCIVDGAIDLASPAGLAWLDHKEGLHHGHYRRVSGVALTPDGGTTTVEVYEVVAPVDFVEAAPAYLQLVRDARQTLGLDTGALDDAAANRPARPLQRFFFYGTLMAGERNAAQLDDIRVQARRKARVRGHLVDCGRYPALLAPPPDGDGVVHGELVEVDADDAARLCARLDPFEGFFAGFGDARNLYERRVITVEVDVEVDIDDNDHGGDLMGGRLAWVYVRAAPPSPADDAARIKGGDWRQHRPSPP